MSSLTLLALCPLLVCEPNQFAAEPPNTMADFGYTPLSDSLDGWTIPEGDNGHWTHSNGTIRYDAGSEAPGDKNLTTKENYADFICRLEWRLLDAGPLAEQPIILPDGSLLKDATGNPIAVVGRGPDSGVYLRGFSRAQLNIWNWPVGSGEMYGFRNGTKYPASLRAAVTPNVSADNPLGEWNRFDIVCVGRTVTVLLNDHLVIDRAELPEEFPLSGPLVLQHHGGYDESGALKKSSSVVEFRNIWIKSLPRPDAD